MSRHATTVSTACLIGAGAVAWALTARPLTGNAELDVPLNPFGIRRSPYGEVFAMAMQSPIDRYFDANLKSGAAGNGHEDHDHAPVTAPGTLEGRLENLLASLESAENLRTNPKAAGKAHRRYLRRQVEDKLRFAYQLDPSHYANYNSLHFFLTEPELGTRPELTPSAARLAEETIEYCLKEENDPRPSLTAAAACTNILELMFNDSRNDTPRFTIGQMRQYLAMLDFCLHRHATLATRWSEEGHWQLLSPQRIAECDDRFTFICKIRETASATIDRLEGRPQPQASN